MGLLKSVTGFFTGGWQAYAIVAVASAVIAGSTVGYATYKITSNADAVTLAAVQHKLDVSDGQVAVLSTKLGEQTRQALADKKVSDDRTKKAQAEQAEADKRAAAANARANDVLKMQPGADLDISTLETALKGIQ